MNSAVAANTTSGGQREAKAVLGCVIPLVKERKANDVTSHFGIHDIYQDFQEESPCMSAGVPGSYHFVPHQALLSIISCSGCKLRPHFATKPM